MRVSRIDPDVQTLLDKAAKAGIDPAELYLLPAGISRATWYRWRTGIGKPDPRAISFAHIALDAELARPKQEPRT